MTKGDAVVIRPAVRSDFEEWHGIAPRTSCRMWVVEYEGISAAIFGYTLEDGYGYAFSQMREDLTVSKRLILETSKRMVEILTARNVPLIAEARSEMSGKLLARLGFKHLDGDLYTWNLC